MTRASLPSIFFPQTTSGDAPSTRGAMGIADVFAAVSVYARLFALLPMHVYRKGDAGRVRVQDSRFANLLRAPVPGVASSSWRGHLGATLALYGEAFVGLYRNADGEVEQLGPLHPDRMEVGIVGAQPVYVFTDDMGNRQELTTRDVIHIRGPLSLDGLRGCSPVRYCRSALATAKSITEHADALWASGGLPPGILTVPAGPAADDQMGNLDRDWNARKRGRVALLSGEVKFDRLGLSNTDAEFIESANWSSQTVARMFGLPPWAIFAPSGDSLTYSTVEGQLKALVTLSMSPWFVVTEDAFSANTELCPGNAYAHVEVEGVMRGDMTARSAFYAAALDPANGWMTRAEVRELEDLPAESEVLTS